MSHGKQFTLFTHKRGPNGWKVAVALEELGLTYESIYLDFTKGEHKEEAHTKYNPNGRIPTLIDHQNNDFVLWESNAILLYLVDRYDPEHKISASTEEGKYKQLQWLFFQASGQGPYYGQAGWFVNYHPEKVPSAIERYVNEIKRVLGVLESVLSKQEWLVEDRPTIADFAFVHWNGVMRRLPEQGYDPEKEIPATYAWHKKLQDRPVFKKLDGIKAEVIAQ